MKPLKEVLGDTLFLSIASTLGESEAIVVPKGTKLVVDDGSFIPKYRLDEVLKQKETLEAQVTKAEKDMKDLKKAAEGNTDLTGKIEELQGAMKQAKAEGELKAAEVKKTFAIKEALMNAGVGDPEARDLLSLKFDPLKVELESDGKVKGFEDMVKPIRENKSFAGMFGTTRIAGQGHQDGELPPPELGEYGKKNPFSKEHRNIALQVTLLRDRPEVAAKLKTLAQVP